MRININMLWVIGLMALLTQAAAAGTIVAMANGDPTDHNPCDGGGSSDNWNYVYNGQVYETSFNLVSNFSLPSSWVGSVTITSDRNVVAVGRPHIGSEVASYGGFPAGALSASLPMLFKNAFGGTYNSTFYVQNVQDSSPASIVISYYDSAGALSCTRDDTILAFSPSDCGCPASRARRNKALNHSCAPAGGGLLFPAGDLSFSQDRNTRQGPRFLMPDEQAGLWRCGQLVCGLCPADVIPQRQLFAG